MGRFNDDSDPDAIPPDPPVPDLRQQRRRFFQRVHDEGVGILLARAANTFFDSHIPSWECRATCKFTWVDAADAIDWEAYDCYRKCMGLPPARRARRPPHVRAARRAAGRIAPLVARRGGTEDDALSIAYLTLALTVVLLLVIAIAVVLLPRP